MATGDELRAPKSAAEWASLPEVVLPMVRDTASRGSVYTVRKVGFLAVAPVDCKASEISGALELAGKCLLPTAVVFHDGEAGLHRLPLGLCAWVYEAIVQAKSGRNPFPCEVEFGTLSGRAYAEIL